MATPVIGFQGEVGAYSEQAIHKFFPNGARPMAYKDFAGVFRAVSRGKVKAGVVPIENSLAGSIHQNYDHLLKHKVWIRAEYKLRISHNLLAPKGVALRDIKRVFSHPQALAQCEKFIKSHRRIQPIPFFDTSGSMKHILDNGWTDAAAIASEDAARSHGVRMLAKAIEDHEENFTRFILLQAKETPPPKNAKCKTSVVFALKNIPGALYKALSIFAIRDIDLHKIESRPLPGSPWKYLFYLDFAGSHRDEGSRKALDHLSEITKIQKVLGSYPAV